MTELLVALALVGICTAIGLASFAHCIRLPEARGAAQIWQAAAGWAQIGVLWHGGSARVNYEHGAVSVSRDAPLSGGDLGPVAPSVASSANVARWHEGEGVSVGFSGTLASPDGGGSVFFAGPPVGYRVAVRPVSGLTSRACFGTEQ